MKTFSLRPTVHFGPDALESLDGLAGKRVFLVTDEFLYTSGLADRVTAHLKDCRVQVFHQVTPDPTLPMIALGVKAMQDFSPQAVLAFGGGSPMDAAKAIRYFSPWEELPLYAIPTTAGSGSEVTAVSVLTDTDGGTKIPLTAESLLPDVAILDPGFLEGVPPAVTADTGMDVLTHALESYVALGADPFTDALAEKAFSLAWESLPGAWAGQMDRRGDMLLSSCLAGMAFQGAGLGICHSLSHVLGGRYHVPHGRLNGVLLPQVMAFNAREEWVGRKYARLAAGLGLAGNPRALSGALRRLGKGLGLPADLEGCGIPREEVERQAPQLARMALEDLCTRGNPIPADEEGLAGILRECI